MPKTLLTAALALCLAGGAAASDFAALDTDKATVILTDRESRQCGAQKFEMRIELPGAPKRGCWTLVEKSATRPTTVRLLLDNRHRDVPLEKFTLTREYARLNPLPD